MQEQHNPEIDRIRQAEFIARFLDSNPNIDALHGHTLEETLKDGESRTSFIASLSEQEFTDLLNGINGVLRGKDKADWKMDGGEVMLGSFTEEHFPPREQDKPTLLHEAYSAAKRMNELGRSLEDTALLVSASVNDIHAYADGNGRTSRLVYTLLTRGYNDEVRAHLKDLLDEEGRQYVDANPMTVSRYIEDIMYDRIGVSDEQKNPSNLGNYISVIPTSEFQFNDGISEEDQKAFRAIIRQDDKYAFYALFPYFNSLPDKEKYIEIFPTHASIRIDKLVSDMNSEDIKRVMENYWGSKKEHTELLIDCIENPNKPEYQIDVQGENISLLEYFKKNLRE